MTMTIRLDLFVFHLFARRQFGSKGVYQFDMTQLKFQSQRCETRARVVIVTLRKCSFVLQRSGKLQLRQVPSGVTIITSKLKLFSVLCFHCQVIVAIPPKIKTCNLSWAPIVDSLLFLLRCSGNLAEPRSKYQPCWPPIPTCPQEISH